MLQNTTIFSRKTFSAYMPGTSAAVLAVLGIFIASVQPARAQVDVLQYHGNTTTSTGVNSNETQLTPATVNVSNFAKLFSVSITDVPNITGIPTSVLASSQNYAVAGGQAYGEPLVKTGVNITTPAFAGTHDVVFVTTTLDSLYAIDANGGTILWKDSFIYNAAGNPNSLNPTIASGITAVPGAYGTETNSQDIEPWIGIIGTPVIDGVNGYIYFVAKTREADGNENQPHYVSTLHKVRLADGLDANTVIADTTFVSATSYTFNSGPYVLGNGTGATTVSGQSRVYFNAIRQMTRPALVLYGGRIYIASGSHGDNGPYHGWILTYDATSLTLNGVWNSCPNGSEGEAGVWQGGGGVTIDPANGYIYFETGNGAFDGTVSNGVVSGLTSSGFPVNGNYGDCFVKLTLDSTTSQGNQGTNLNGWGLKIVDYFSPYNNHALDNVDEDLGSGGSTLLPDSVGSAAHPHLILGGGKQGNLYLIDRDNMGKFGATDSVVQIFSGALNGLLSTPTYFNGSIYATDGYGGNTRSWPIANGVITTGSGQTSTDGIGFPGCSPYVTANGTSNGIVWVIDKSTGELRAYNASNLSQELWTSDLNSNRDILGNSVKFTVATPANGKVYVGTSDHLVAYGQASAATSPPAAPTALTATPTSATTVTLNWTDNSNNETGFLIERSLDGVNFSQIGTVGINVTTYGDSGLSSQGTYYYRVRATNLYNTVSYSAYTNVATATTPAVGTQIPVDLYSFDEGAGTTTVDSAAGNNGTLTGTPLPAWVTPGRVGSANLSFSGSGVYDQVGQSAVQLKNDLSPVLGSTSSLLFWIKTTQTGSNTHWMAPAVTGVEQTGGSNDIGWGYLDGNGHICLAVGDNTLSSASRVNDGTWHHVAITRNATSGAVIIYVDGVVSSSGNLGAGNQTSQFLLIGARSVVNQNGITFTGANFLNAQLDDVRIYNQVVTQALVSSIAFPPAAVANLSVTAASGTELDLSWTANSTNVTGYEVWSAIGTGSFVRIAQLAPTATSYANTGLSPGTLYYYFVRAINTSGTADSSIVNATTPTPPATPTNPQVVGLVPTQVDLSWVNNATNGLGCYVLRSTGGGTFVQVANLGATATYYADTGVQAGTTYNYHIQCYNNAGVSDFAGLAATTPTTWTTPAAATNVTFTSTSSTAGTLTWVDNGLNATSYQVWVSINGGTYSQLATLPANATSYALTGLSTTNSYTYYVTAVNSMASTNSTTVTTGQTVVYVSNLAWTQIANGWGPVEKDTSNGEQAAGDGRTISIRGTTFAKGLGCHAASEVDVPLNGAYSIFSSAVGIDDETNGQGTGVDFQVIANGTVLFDSGTLNGTSPIKYTGNINVSGVTTLRLLVNIVGNNNSYDHSDWGGAQVVPATGITAPLAPTNLVATALTSTTGSLTWVNAATNATSNQVWVSAAGAAYTQLAQVASNVTSYALTGLSATTTYSYYVVAVNGSGSTASTKVNKPVFVSDLAWTQIANGWGPVEKDTSNGEAAAGDGRTISIRGTTFAKGLGCHAASEVDVPLNGAYSTFSSAVGIDDETNGQGTGVDFQVIANGAVLYDSGTLYGTSAIKYTGNINVSGVTTLRLVINIVGANNYYDHSDWAGAQVTQ